MPVRSIPREVLQQPEAASGLARGHVAATMLRICRAQSWMEGREDHQGPHRDAILASGVEEKQANASIRCPNHPVCVSWVTCKCAGICFMPNPIAKAGRGAKNHAYETMNQAHGHGCTLWPGPPSLQNVVVAHDHVALPCTWCRSEGLGFRVPGPPSAAASRVESCEPAPRAGLWAAT